MANPQEALICLNTILESINNCLRRKSNFDNISLTNLLEKETGFEEFVKNIEIPTDDTGKFVESVFNLVADTNEESLMTKAKATLEKMKTSKMKIPKGVMERWFSDKDEEETVIKQNYIKEKMEFLKKAFINVQFCARTQKKFDNGSIERFMTKDKNQEMANGLGVKRANVDEYLTSIIRTFLILGTSSD